MKYCYSSEECQLYNITIGKADTTQKIFFPHFFHIFLHNVLSLPLINAICINIVNERRIE